MDTPQKKKASKDLIPKKAQIILLIVGIPLLIFTVVRVGTQLGWIGGPPRAKEVVQRKEDKPKPPEATSKPEPAEAATRPAGPGKPAVADLPPLESIELADRDPLADLNPPPPKPGESAPATPAGSGPGPAPSEPVSRPPLPPPTPPGAGSFPSPMPGEAPALPPAMAALQPRERGLPPALSANYPLLRRGRRAPRTASISLVGTVSGPAGSIAVVRPVGSEGAQGRYVRPGQTVAGGGEEVKAIGPGKMTLKNRGRTQELSLPAPGSQTTPGGGTGESAAGQPKPGPGHSQPIVEGSHGISPPTE
jgi:hypothetical protein